MRSGIMAFFKVKLELKALNLY